MHKKILILALLATSFVLGMEKEAQEKENPTSLKQNIPSLKSIVSNTLSKFIAEDPKYSLSILHKSDIPTELINNIKEHLIDLNLKILIDMFKFSIPL